MSVDLRDRTALDRAGQVRAVLFDRDDTLVLDVPRYNGDPELVTPIAGAAEALARLRRSGLPIGVVSNQSGIGRGLVTAEQVQAVNARIDSLLGPMDTWRYCPHAPADACTCRKPAPALIEWAAADLGVAPEQVAVVGDIGSDVDAARAAGAVGILVPSPRTLAEEVARADVVADTLADAVELILATRTVAA